MSRRSRRQRAAALPVALRAGWGVTLLLAPGTVLRIFGSADATPGPRLVMRILGSRQLVQAAIERRFGGAARETGVVVDLLHGSTSIGFAVMRPRWRRPALIDGAVAAGFAVLGITNR